MEAYISSIQTEVHVKIELKDFSKKDRLNLLYDLMRQSGVTEVIQHHADHKQLFIDIQAACDKWS